MNSLYTFENFVVGKENELAFTAARAVVEKPSFYNPLFIYGGSGLGKTHLLYAIKTAACDQYGNEAVLFMSGEELSSMFIRIIRKKKYSEFEQKLGFSMFLLLDDLHTLIGKAATQEELVHLLRSVVNRGQQVILTASAEPSELPVLEDSLRNEFNNCLIADIQPLNYETSKTILLDKLYQSGLQLSNAEIDQIARDADGQVRHLEGIIKKMEAEKRFTCLR